MDEMTRRLARSRGGFYNIELVLLILALAAGFVAATQQKTWGSALGAFLLAFVGAPLALCLCGALLGWLGRGEADRKAKEMREMLAKSALERAQLFESEGSCLNAFQEIYQAQEYVVHGVDPALAAEVAAAIDRLAPKAYEALLRRDGDPIVAARAAARLSERRRLGQGATISPDVLFRSYLDAAENCLKSAYPPNATHWLDGAAREGLHQGANPALSERYAALRRSAPTK